MTSIFAANETTFATVDEAVAADAFPDYLTRMAEDLAELKAGLHAMLDVSPGERVIDVGCGTGADVRALAARVAPGGSVDGVDNSQRLVEEARLQTPLSGEGISFHTGDAHDLPFVDSVFDAARAERVLMHLAEPARAVRELVRVTKPGGRVLIADPDHGMWALDLPDRGLTRTLMAWWFDFIANPWIARSGPALAAAAGLTQVRTRLFPIVFQDLAAADSMTGLTKIAGAAVSQGVVSADEAAAFGDALAARQADRSFFMCGAVIATVGHVPL